MYLHIGSGVLCDDSSIIGIFDLDNLTSSSKGTEFLEKAEKNHLISNIGGSFDLPKSIILTDHAAYISPITSQTLYRRSRLELGGLLNDNDQERQK